MPAAVMETDAPLPPDHYPVHDQLVRVTYRRFLLLGFTPQEAARLTATLHGLHGDFTPKQLAAALFLRWQHERDDMADSDGSSI